MSDFFLENSPVQKEVVQIGALNDDCEEISHDDIKYERFMTIEKDREMLSSSLFELTTHFAQVQFRLGQVIHALPEEKEQLLESLEEFACRAVPDMGMVPGKKDQTSLLKELSVQRKKQEELLSNLKEQLLELDNYAFRGERNGKYEKRLNEQLKVILKEVKSRINLSIDEKDIIMMNSDDLIKEIGSSLDNLTSPMARNERLIHQFKIQIADLEKFVVYLQNKIRSTKKNSCTNSVGVLNKLANILEMFATTQFSCIRKNNKKYTDETKENKDPYKQLETNLGQTVDEVQYLVNRTNEISIIENSINKSDSYLNLTKLVRESLTTSLEKLITHGTYSNPPQRLKTVCCFPRRLQVGSQLDVWDILLKYYRLQNESYSALTSNLFKSFNLIPIELSPKDELVWCIKNIISIHKQYKTKSDSQFKDFLCSALNSKMLVDWFRLIFSNKQLVKECYQPWSYVAKTEFKDCLNILGSLSKYEFDLPVDLEVAQFNNMTDMFY